MPRTDWYPPPGTLYLSVQSRSFPRYVDRGPERAREGVALRLVRAFVLVGDDGLARLPPDDLHAPCAEAHGSALLTRW